MSNKRDRGDGNSVIPSAMQNGDTNYYNSAHTFESCQSLFPIESLL